MMFGTVMMSTHSGNGNESVVTSHKAPPGQPISSISNLVSKSYHEYMSESELVGVVQQSHQRQHRSAKSSSKGGSFDQQSLSSRSGKPIESINENSDRYSSETTANNLRKQHSHYEQHTANRQQQQQVLFNEENNYSKMKAEKRDQQQHIQVQILPQDDNWGENTTAFTADLSDDMTEDGRSTIHANYDADQAKSSLSFGTRLRFYTARHFELMCALCVAVAAFVTPLLFIVLPRVNIWQVAECGLECEGLLVSIAFKMFILLIGAWALFARRPRAAQLPRVYEMRLVLLVLLGLLTFSYWLFYAVRIIEARTTDYHEILEFCASYVDVLLFIFVVGVLVLELRPIRPEFVVRMVRSPDGEQSEYSLGAMSIQMAAIWLLEQYYKDFAVYNPWLESSHKKRGAQLMQLEQASIKRNKSSSRSLKDEDTASKKLSSTNMTANERFYEEYEYERRLRKRRARLLTTTEEAFVHVRRVQQAEAEQGTTVCMDPFETAQVVFTSIARDLRRYLRVTRQQPYFTRESIVAHLANCISYDMTPKAFLQRYLKAEPLLFNERALVNATTEQNRQLSTGLHGGNYHLNLKTMDQSWILICDTALYQNCEDNLMLVLKQNEVSLMCTFKRLPRFNLIEDVLDPKRNKFVLKINSETTV